MKSASVLIPEALHICPRCGDLASGATLCEDCVALQELGRRVDEGLRRQLHEQRWGRVRRSTETVAVWLLFWLLGAGVLSLAVLAGMWAARVCL